MGMAQHRRGRGSLCVLAVMCGTVAAAGCGEGAEEPPADLETLAQATLAPPAWKVGTKYVVGAQVTFANIVYECRQAHTSVTGWEPPRALSLWQRPTPSGLLPWTTQTHYLVGSEVTFNGTVYRARQQHVSQVDWTPPVARSLWAPPNVAPTVTIVAPAAGSQHLPGTSIRLQANVVDPDGPSPFAGTVVWLSDVDGPLCESATCLTAPLTAGAHILTVRATDPAGASASASVEIVVNTPPTADIVAPAEGSAVFAGQQLVFRGAGLDPEQEIAGAALSWSSDRDGALGTGEELAATLSPGTHRVTLTATDTFGATGSASIAVLVSPLFGPPSALILAPANDARFAPGTVIELQGLGFDPEDGLLPEDSYAWSSDLDGPLGTGSTLAALLTGPGGDTGERVHRVTLTVTDSEGNTASTDILVHIGGP